MRIVQNDLIPAALLVERARLAASREERVRLETLAENLSSRARNETDEIAYAALEALARELAALWQRTTSRIEGRNGHLSQRHHDQRGLTERKLACLTHIHNFHTRGADGQTAAEKLFGKTHIVLARATLAGMGELKRPRISRQAA